MRRFSVFSYGTGVLCLCLLFVFGCKETSSLGNKEKPGKWLPYNEKSALAEQHLRAKLNVERREARTNTLSDSGEVWFASEITLYNRYGQPTLSQEMDQSGKIVKETRSDYRDSLLVRQAVTEASGYSSAIEFTYNPQQQKIGELLFQRGDSVLRRTYTLDVLGNEMEVSLLKFRDGSTFKLLTQRDEMGRPTTVKELQAAKTNWSETYTLSDSLWRIKRVDSTGKLQSDYEMRFDANGSIIRMVNRTPDGKTRLRVEYQNDAQGRPVKESFFGGNDQPFQTYEYRYNEEGLLIERKLIAPNQPFALTTQYSYFYRK
jgi:YD repeat-containing protein